MQEVNPTAPKQPSLGSQASFCTPIPRESSREKKRTWTEGPMMHPGKERQRGEWGAQCCLVLLCFQGVGVGTRHPQDQLCPLLAGTSGQSTYPCSRGSY